MSTAGLAGLAGTSVQSPVSPGFNGALALACKVTLVSLHNILPVPASARVSAGVAVMIVGVEFSIVHPPF
ncbi:hypothetical protein D3C85_1872070 [compost metagenome]